MTLPSLSIPKLLSVLVVVGFAAGCGTKMAPTTISPVNVRAEYQSDTRDAIARALAAKKYAVESEEQGKVIARWSDEDAWYRVAIVHQGSTVNLEYLDSNPPGEGKGMAPKRYVSYMQKLRSLIEDELGAPMRDAAGRSADAAALEKRKQQENERRRRIVLVARERPAAELRAAVARALADRSYAIESEKDTTITARWNKGDRFYRLRVTYGPKQIEIAYVDGSDEDDDDGVRVAHEDYVEYMRRLAGSLEEIVNRK
jgi:hypothetical protein